MTQLDKLIHIKSNNIKPIGGRILISEPLLNDFYFGRSVVLLIEHNEDGSFGVIVNKPIHVKIQEAIPDFPDFETNIYLGGPVSTEQIFFLHTIGEAIEGSMKITNDGVYWGGDLDIVKEMISMKTLDPQDIRFFIGYSGWVPKQLENELKSNSWLVSPTSKNEIFSESPEKLWNTIVKRLGENYTLWTQYPLDPNMN
ncbi:MAG: YqgE/AlgH family protein [Bacteroidota bacterium]